MRKIIAGFILGILLGLGIGQVIMQKELKAQEAYYVNQLEVQHCMETDGVCD